MAEIRVNNEQQLIDLIKTSDVYTSFTSNQIKNKIEREKETWELIKKYRRKYTEDLLNKIFDKVDYYAPNKRWFGQLLAKPNRILIFESSIEDINKWIESLLFSDEKLEDILNKCLIKNKIRGASKGLASLLLYLSNSVKYNIWVNKTQEGLFLLNRISNLRGKNWGNNYQIFNAAAIEFRDLYKFQSQEVDWILTFIATYIESGDDYFLINEDSLKINEVSISVDDDAELDDIVGEPMELNVMRWTPTNEMGVVALFIEFRTQLGFPLVEIIRTRFPDAAVFETSSKGFIRRYVEFEFKSSGYKSHLKSNRKCHYVICWEHDWKDCPIPVIELKKEVPKLLKHKS